MTTEKDEEIHEREGGTKGADREKIKERVEIFRRMIRLRTVSHTDDSLTDREAFRLFRTLLKDSYPAIEEAGEWHEIGPYGLLIHIRGKREEDPSVLMAHMDVVDVTPETWSTDPFGAEERGGRIFGRGTLDTKSTLFAIMEAVEEALLKGWRPGRDLFLSFGGEEEIAGECTSRIVDWFRERHIKPSFVLDEGGAVIPEGLPGVKGEAAMIGIAEKGSASFLLTAEGSGGHAAAPPRVTAAGRIARAAARVERFSFPARLSRAVKAMFMALEDYAPLPARPAFRHPSLAGPAIAALSGFLGPTTQAMVRTQATVTMLSGGVAFNVLPERAEAGVNVRILEGDTVESVERLLKKVIGDPKVTVTCVGGSDPSPVSETDCGQYRMLKAVIAGVYPGAHIAPYQMNGGTDARFYAAVTPYVYRFTPMPMTKEERASVHGRDESIQIRNLFRMVSFYKALLAKL